MAISSYSLLGNENIKDNDHIKSLSEASIREDIESLTIDDCDKLKDLNDIKNYKKLKSLTIKDMKLKDLNFLPDGSDITYLDLSDSENISDWSGILRLTKLETLIIKDCDLEKIPEEIFKLENIKKLDMRDNDDIRLYSIEELKKAKPNTTIISD